MFELCLTVKPQSDAVSQNSGVARSSSPRFAFCGIIRLPVSECGVRVLCIPSVVETYDTTAFLAQSISMLGQSISWCGFPSTKRFALSRAKFSQ